MRGLRLVLAVNLGAAAVAVVAFGLWQQARSVGIPAGTGHPKGFYEPAIDPTTKLYDLTTVGGIPKGKDGKEVKAVLASDGTPLAGRDGLLDSLVGDVAMMKDLNGQIQKQRELFKDLQAQTKVTDARVEKMGRIRDSVQAELFFLSTFEVNVFETRETVLRREKQLRERLRILGINNP